MLGLLEGPLCSEHGSQTRSERIVQANRGPVLGCCRREGSYVNSDTRHEDEPTPGNTETLSKTLCCHLNPPICDSLHQF